MVEVEGNIVGVDFEANTLKIALNGMNCEEMNKYLQTSLKAQKMGKYALKIGLYQNRKKRSLDANAYFHSLVNQLARYYGVSDEEMKVQMVCSYGAIWKTDTNETYYVCLPENINIRNVYEYSVPISRKKGNGCNLIVYKLYKRTRDLNSKEFAALIEGTRHECETANEDGAGISYLTPEEEAQLEYYESI